MPTSEPSRGWSECRCREGRHLSLETEATPTPATATWSWRRTRNKSQSQLLLSSLCECLKAFFLFFCHLVSHMLLTAGWQHTSSFVYSERNCHRKKKYSQFCAQEEKGRAQTFEELVLGKKKKRGKMRRLLSATSAGWLKIHHVKESSPASDRHVVSLWAFDMRRYEDFFTFYT